MPREETVVKRFDLSNGFVTEFTELNFPENATVDESNMTIENDGSRKRRKGIDYEDNAEFESEVGGTSVTLSAFKVMEWRAVGGNPDLNFLVVQSGRFLHFYERDGDTFSDNKAVDTIDLGDFKVGSASTSNLESTRVSGAYGTTRFFVAGKYVEPFYIERTDDVTNDHSISGTQVSIEERDFKGVDDSLDVDERPSSLSDEHDYNLQNQGWPAARISTFNTDRTEYPSNADIWHFGKYIDPSTGTESFDSDQVADQAFGNARAPRGSFLKDIFTEISSVSTLETEHTISTFTHDGSTATVTTGAAHGLSAGDSIRMDETSFDYNTLAATVTYTYDEEYFEVSSVNSSTQFEFEHDISNFISYDSTNTAGNFTVSDFQTSGVSTDERPTSVAFYAGRVWWAGIQDSVRANRVYFTQILQSEDNIGRCYQEADPTSEHISELIDTDGGVITVSEMGTVKNMTVVGKNLVLFADNGIWNIGPGQEGFFTATSFSIRKISSVEISSPESVVLAEGVPVVWTYQGIYALGEDQVSGFINTQSLTADTIQTFYRDISDESKEKAAGTYDDVSKKFYWVYSSDSSAPTKYDKCLIFDAKHEAFQKFEFKKIPDVLGTPVQQPFVAEVSTTLGFDNPDNKVKFLTPHSGNGNFTWSNLNDSTFHDWATADAENGVDAEAYLVTGYETGGDAARDKQTPIVTFLFKRTETGTNASGELLNPGSCLMQARWDWADNSNSNKWNPEREVYRLRRTFFTGSHPSATFEDGYPVVRSRQKVRGRGSAFNMRLKSKEDHDLHIIGWQMTLSGGSTS